MDIGYFLKLMTEKNASDMFLTTGAPVYIKIEGKLYPLGNTGLPAGMVKKIAYSLMDEGQVPQFERDLELNMALSLADAGRFRVSVFRQKGHLALVLRLIPFRLLSFEEIGLPKICRALCRRPRGLFLVTGPTGSGKTTTLASMLNYINMNFDRHIVTVEDPIEYYHNHKKSIVNQREVGVDVPSFSEALRRVLRQDPDVILVGELRDLETMESAIRAAETGHLVFSTVHTTGCQGTVNRIIDAFPVDQQEQIRVQLSTNLIAVLSQALCPKLPKGMVAAYEFMVVTPAISNLIRENKTYRVDSAIQTGKKYGMQLLDEHLWTLYAEGKIDASEAIDKSRRPGDMQDKIDAHRRGQAITGEGEEKKRLDDDDILRS